MQDLTLKLGNKLRSIREQYPLSQKALADICKVHDSTISRMEHGQIASIGIMALVIALFENNADISAVKKVRVLTSHTLKRERKNMKLSKYKLAKFLDVAPSTVGYWESGKLDIGSSMMMSFAISQLKTELLKKPEMLEIAVTRASNMLFEQLAMT